MLQENTDNYKAIKISKVITEAKSEVALQPLKRCSKEGVSDFIAREATSYQYKNVGTIHNSVAKKAVDAELRTEQKEIEAGLLPNLDISESHRVKREYSSNISIEKLKEILLTRTTSWVFQTSNSHKLVTFYAKSETGGIEVFINFKDSGDSSHILLGYLFGYLPKDTLDVIREDLSEVFEKITEETEKVELISEVTLWDNTISRIERIKQEDPDTWNEVRYEALQKFTAKKELTLFEKFLNLLNISGFAESHFYEIPTDFSLSDEVVENYLLDCIKIDIKQVYA